MVDQSLCPTDQTKCPKALWLNLDWNVEILRWVRACYTLRDEIKPVQSNKLRMELHLCRLSEIKG